MATATRTDALIHMFDDHPSLSASLESFENNERHHADMPSLSHHSAVRSDSSEPALDSPPDSPWSPPGWQNTTQGSGWYRHQPYLQEPSVTRSSPFKSRSKETSAPKGYGGEDDDPTLPANIPLPRGSLSPCKELSPSPAHNVKGELEWEDAVEARTSPVASPEPPQNYIRFAVRAEVQQRTEPLEAALAWLQSKIDQITRSRTSLGASIGVVFLAFIMINWLLKPPIDLVSPDLIKAAGLARSFEPMIYYSENGVSHIGELQETGVAVWDLGESVRAANMTSAPIIVAELDGLTESLSALAQELTSFFAAVDGDIDNILIVMDWARRELNAISAQPPGPLSSALSNMHNLLSNIGLLTNPWSGAPNGAARALNSIFGLTPTERVRRGLQRTFVELLSAIEEGINNELRHTARLFSLFATIDQQFLNLQRSTIREFDTQERLETEVLSSLWTRALGGQAGRLKKFEKNKTLLRSIRERTVLNKNMLVDHNGKLMALKQNLELLRRRLMGPIVRGGEGSTVGVDEQIRGLEATHDYLRRVKETHKGKAMETLWGGRKKAKTIDGSA